MREYYLVLVNGVEEYEDIDKMMAEWVAEGYTSKGCNDVVIKHVKESKDVWLKQRNRKNILLWFR